MGEIKMHTILWLQNLKGRELFEDLGVDVRIILELILGKEGREVWIGFIWLRVGTSGGLF
jgi:hypothetical protein